MNGHVTLLRIRWHCPTEGSDAPLDRVLDAAEAAVSEGVREMACRLNRGSHSFAAAAANLLRTAHLSLSKELLRQVVESEGQAVVAAIKQGRLAPDWQACDCPAPQEACAAAEAGGQSPPTRLYLGSDGVKVPVVTDVEKRKRRQKTREKRQKSGRRCRPLPRAKPGADQAFKEFRIVTVYNEDQSRRFVVGTRGNCEATGKVMQQLATQVQLGQADERIANIDGAPWIRNQIEFYGLVENIGLDYYHLRDYVRRTRRAIFGDGDSDASISDQPRSPGAEWERTVMGVFYERGGDAGWEHLYEWRKTLRGSARQAASKLLNYVGERRDIICYPTFREQGWQIGSGPTEAQCKTATSRLKGRGRRWDAVNAEAIMALDCLESSHAWDLYWPTQAAA